MFPELREAKPDNETAAGMLARAVRHDLSSMARVRAVTGTLCLWSNKRVQRHHQI